MSGRGGGIISLLEETGNGETEKGRRRRRRGGEGKEEVEERDPSVVLWKSIKASLQAVRWSGASLSKWVGDIHLAPTCRW